MSKTSKIFELMNRLRGKETSAEKPSADVAASNFDASTYSIPTVNFDSSLVTEVVKLDLWNNVLAIPDIGRDNFENIYASALSSISAGRNLNILSNAVMRMNIEGITKQRAAEIAQILNNKATAIINIERQQALGITHALWLYSGAPCHKNRNPTVDDIRQDAAHKAANRKKYEISKGMFLDGKWTSPGREDGCRCVAKSVVKGLS